MACSLSITLVRGNPATPGGMTTSSIRVEGTVAECEPFTLDNTAPRDVVVMVDCGAGPVTVQTLSSAGIWSLGVPATCTCGTPIRVTATCATNPECTDLFSGLLECEEVDCPTGVLAVFAGDCDSSGKRIVTLMASISAAPPGSQGGWVFGDGSQGGTFPIVVGPFSETHPYTPPGPAFPAQLVFVQPPDCPPLKATIADTSALPGRRRRRRGVPRASHHYRRRGGPCDPCRPSGALHSSGGNRAGDYCGEPCISGYSSWRPFVVV